MPSFNLIGREYGRLIPVLECADRRNHFICQCECGNYSLTRKESLLNGKSKSCGCLHREIAAIRQLAHGFSVRGKISPTYRAYQSMLQRATNPNLSQWRDYGGRGITVCERWQGSGGFLNFLLDMGERPGKGFTLDRKDNDKGYSPENCQWADWRHQARNKRSNVFVVFGDSKMILKDACAKAKASYDLVRARLKRGWDFMEAISVPPIPFTDSKKWRKKINERI